MWYIHIKKIICFLVISFLLLGCEYQKYCALIFTSDYVYGNDESYVLLYENCGNVLEEIKISGALHYNIINHDEKYLLKNNEYTVEIDDKFNIVNKNNKMDYGIVEMNNLFENNGNIISIHNYGYTNGNKYLTYIDNSYEYLKIEGFVICYSVYKSDLSILLKQDMKLNIITVSLDTLKIVNTLEVVEISKESNYFGISNANSTKNFYFFIRKENETLIYIYDQQSKEIKNYKNNCFDITEILPTSLICIDNKVYYLSNSKELKYFYLDINNFLKIIDTEVKLPNDIGSFPLVKLKDNMLYFLDAGSRIKMVEVDLNNYIVRDEIILEYNIKQKNLQVYDFLVF